MVVSILSSLRISIGSGLMGLSPSLGCIQITSFAQLGTRIPAGAGSYVAADRASMAAPPGAGPDNLEAGDHDHGGQAVELAGDGSADQFADGVRDQCDDGRGRCGGR